MSELTIHSNARAWITQMNEKKNKWGALAEVDFGLNWSQNGGKPFPSWRVTWHEISGVLYAYQCLDNLYVILGHFQKLQEVRKAMGDWSNPTTAYWRNLEKLAEHLQESGCAP
jgi:hypothetical protein